MREQNLLHLSMILAWGPGPHATRRFGFDALWRTLGLGFAIAVIGILFSAMLKKLLVTDGAYVWSLALGLIVWTFLAGTLGDAALAHGRWAPVLRRSPMPFVAVLLSIPLRWAPVLAVHLLLLAAARWVVVGSAWSPAALLAAFVLLLANGAWMAVAGGYLCARFSLATPLLRWGVHLALFLTPVLWPDYFLGYYQPALALNPLYHLIVVVRAGIEGVEAVPVSWAIAAVMAVMGGGAAVAVHRRRASTE